MAGGEDEKRFFTEGKEKRRGAEDAKGAENFSL
jgi:hypothetical protein